jgi:hypothetical protein
VFGEQVATQIEPFRHMALPEGGIARVATDESVQAFAAVPPFDLMPWPPEVKAKP